MKHTTFTSFIVVTVLGFLIPMHAGAFGLGTLELSSALNEPFKGEISVTALRDDEAENIEVRLASNEEFMKAGLDLNLALTQLEFEVIQGAENVRILVTSKQAIKEPFLDFLLTATTGEGRLIREYTVLLDPPKDMFTSTDDVSIPATAAPAPVELLENNSTENIASTTYYQDSLSDVAAMASYGLTDRTDTLWEIALKVRSQENLSVHQMMMALLNENPSAFSHGNINELKVGQTLSVPSPEEIKQLSKTQAIAAVTEQNRLWNDRNTSQSVIQTLPEVQNNELAEEQVAQSQVDSTEIETSVVMNEDDSARLQLVVPSEHDTISGEESSLLGSEEVRQLSEQLTLTQETLEGQVQENIDFKERMDAMEVQLETMRRLISLKDADLARLQSALEAEQSAELPIDMESNLHEEASTLLDEYAVATELNEDNSANQYVANEVEPLEDISSQNDELPFDEMAGDVSLDEVAEEINDDMNASEVDATTADQDWSVETAEQTINESFDGIFPTIEDVVSAVSTLMNMETDDLGTALEKIKKVVANNIIAMALVFLLVSLFLWWLIRRYNRADVTWDEAIEKVDEALVTAEPETLQEEDDSLADINLATDEAASTQDVHVKTADDLMTQAEMFIGYADYIQARTSLEKAQELEPDNKNVIRKLLFVLFKQQETELFVTLTRQANFEKTSYEWDEVTAWGRELDPDQELFKVEAPIAQEEAEPVSEGDEDNNPISSDDEIDISEQLSGADISLAGDDEAVGDTALSLDIISLEIDDEAVEDVLDMPLSLDITSLDMEEASEIDEAVEDTLETALSLDIASLDMDEVLDVGDEAVEDVSDTALSLDITSLDAEEVSEETVASEDTLDIEPLDISGLESDSALEFDIGDISEIDEAETKLDLAAAYIDMGDSEGAQSILEEVINDADGEQKERAQSMLNDLSSAG